MSQEYSRDEIETVSIDSVHMNKNWSMLTAKLEMCAGDNKLTVPYKIDTESDSNIMHAGTYSKNCFQGLQKLNS